MGSLGALVYPMGVVVFIRCPWVHSGAPWGSLGSSLDIVFARERPGGVLVHLGFLGSLGCSLRFVGFVRCRWEHSGSPWVSLGSLGVVRFTPVCAGVRWDRLQSLDSFGVVGFILLLTGGRWVLPRSLGSLGCA